MDHCIIAADLHGSAKTPKKLKTFQTTLRGLTMLAITYGNRMVVVAGDIFDDRYNTPPSVVLVLLEELNWALDRGVKWVLLPGNHDIASKSQYSHTLLRTFERHATVITQPIIIRADSGALMFFAPWRKPRDLQADLDMLAFQAATLVGSPKVLITHTAIKEGSLGASDFQAESGIKTEDLHPEAYDLVLVGDYHREQQLADNVWYLGSVTEQTYGDRDPGGAHVLDCRGETPVYKSLEFPLPLPRYVSYDFSSARSRTEMVVPEYNMKDYVRISAPPSLVDEAASMWPTAEIREVVTKEHLEKACRFDLPLDSSPSVVFDAFCQGKDLPSEDVAVGRDILDYVLANGKEEAE